MISIIFIKEMSYLENLVNVLSLCVCVSAVQCVVAAFVGTNICL